MPLRALWATSTVRFGASQIAPRVKRKLGKGIPKASVMTMYSWAHYKLRMRLEQKARRTPDFVYTDCKEMYTSRTCSECGTVRPKGRAETFEKPT